MELWQTFMELPGTVFKSEVKFLTFFMGFTWPLFIFSLFTCPGYGSPHNKAYDTEYALAALQNQVFFEAYLIFVIFFTRAKFLESKIYTEKRQFFALNL